MSSDDIQKIAGAILRSVSGMGVAQAGVLGCGSTSGVQNPFSCSYSFPQTYGCDAPQSYRCGGSSGNFSCTGGATDDFECAIDFSCPPPNGFSCHYSFDDEDCQGVFNCNWAFGCGNGGGDYNN
jgi:hypothetical protein